jgi:hypothetical protein
VVGLEEVEMVMVMLMGDGGWGVVVVYVCVCVIQYMCVVAELPSFLKKSPLDDGGDRG